MFAGIPSNILVSLNIFIIIITAVLIAQARIGEKMQKEVEEKGKEALKGKEMVERMLGKVGESVLHSSF